MIKNKLNQIAQRNPIKLHVLLTLSIVLLFGSCDNNRYIEYEVDDQESFLVMFSYLNPDSAFSVQVGLAKLYSDTTKDIELSDCTVEVFEDGQLIENLTYAGNNSYTGIKKPSKGPVYTLSVARKGFSTISASTTIPEPPVISDLHIEQLLHTNPQRVNYDFNLTDPAGGANYYRLLVYQEGYRQPENDSEKIYFFAFIYTLYDQAIFTGMDEGDASDSQDDDNQNKFMIFKDNIFDGQKYRVSCYSGRLYDHTTKVYVVVQQLSRDYYLFMKSYTKSKQYNEFKEPVQVFSNVKNGAGIVGSYAKSELMLVFEQP